LKLCKLNGVNELKPIKSNLIQIQNTKHKTEMNNTSIISYESPSHVLMRSILEDVEEYTRLMVECSKSKNVKGYCKLLDAIFFNPKYPTNQCVKIGADGELLCHIKNNNWQKRKDSEVVKKLVEVVNVCINNYMMYEPEFDEVKPKGVVFEFESDSETETEEVIEEVPEEVSEESSIAERTIQYSDWIVFLDKCGIALGVDEDRKFTHIATEEERVSQKRGLMRSIVNHIKKQEKREKY